MMRVPDVWETLDLEWPADGRPLIRRAEMKRAVLLYMQDAPAPVLAELPSPFPGVFYAYLFRRELYGVGWGIARHGVRYVGATTVLGVHMADLEEALRLWCRTGI